MNAHVANEGMTFLPAAGSRAVTAPRRQGVVAERIAAAVHWLNGLPRRRAVLSELGRLSDRDLADIGLNRGDLPRVFDPAFIAGRNFARKAGN